MIGSKRLKGAKRSNLPDRKEIAEALASARGIGAIGLRIDTISRRFLNCPYRDAPLGGGPGLPEHLDISMDGFDCVTFVETVLALAASRRVDDFAASLRRIRYAPGRMSWRARNHYMTHWAKNNEDGGRLRNLVGGRPASNRQRLLNVVPGVEPRRERFRVFPKRWLGANGNRCKTGDVIMFASTRKNLDVFHLGLIIRNSDGLVLRHASRSTRVVVDEDLLAFAAKHRMSGIILLRPLEPDRGSKGTDKASDRASRRAKGKSSASKTRSRTVAPHPEKGRRADG
jgi:hypothetical protein